MNSDFCWIIILFLFLTPDLALGIEKEGNGWKLKVWSDQHSLVPGGKMVVQVRVERTGSDINWQPTTVSIYGDWGRMVPPWRVVSMNPSVSAEPKTEDPDVIFNIPKMNSGDVFTAKMEILLKTNDIGIGSSLSLSSSVSPSYTSVIFTDWFLTGNRTKNANPSTATAGDPVNTATGEFILPSTMDLDLGGPLPLGFTRFYASALNDPIDIWWQSFARVGHGWSHSFDITIYDTPTSGSDNKSVRLPSGKVIPFGMISGRFEIPKAYAMNFEDEAVRYELKHDGEVYWFLDPEKETIYRFDKNLRCVEMMDRNSNALHIQRSDYDGQATNVSDGLGRSLTLIYNDSRQLAGITDGLRQISYGYNTNGFLTSATNALGEVALYSYDTNNSLLRGNGALMTSVQYPRGNTPITQTFNSAGQVVSQFDAYQNATSFTNNIQTGEMRITDPQAAFIQRSESFRRLTNWVDQAGHAINIDYGGRDLPVAITDRRGSTVKLDYEDGSRRLVELVDSLGQTTRFTYVWTSQTFTNRETGSNLVVFAFRDLARIDYADGTTEKFLRDSRGNITNYVDRVGAIWGRTYNGRGELLTILNPQGGEVTYTYNSDGTLATRSDSDMTAVTHHYDVLRRAIGQTFASDAESRWQLDALDRMISLTNELGGIRTIVYNPNGVIIGATNEMGYSVNITTDLMDRWTNRTDIFGELESTAYDSMGRLTMVKNATGTNIFEYDARGWLSQSARGERVFRYAYDPEGSITQIVSALGYVSRFNYNALGQLVAEVDALSQTNTYQYDAMGRVAVATDALGISTRFGYDPTGHLKAITNGLGKTVLLEYNPLGQILRSVNFDGHATSYGYTPMGRLLSVTNSAGGIVSYMYDQEGRVESVQTPDGAKTFVAYNAADNPIKYTDPASNIWQYAYDIRGELTAVTNPMGGVVHYNYHSDGLLAATADSETSPVTNRYDAARRLSEVIMPNGSIRTFLYNEFDELTALIEADGSSNRFLYDNDGQLARWIDPLGASEQYSYDAAGQLTNKTDRSGADWINKFDAGGRMIATIDPTGVRTEYSYDALGRVTALTIGASTWQFHYNGEGVVTNTIMPSGRALNTVPDSLQRIATVINAAAQTNRLVYDAVGRATNSVDTEGRITAYRYDGRGLLMGVTVPGGRSTTYEYNPLGLLATMEDSNSQKWTFDYTPIGRLRTVMDPLGRVATNQYDMLGRWSASKFPDGVTVSNQYDAVGRIIKRQFSDGLTLSYVYDQAGRLVSTDNLILAYDEEDRVINSKDSEIAFGAAYDAAGRLQSATYNNGAFTVTYEYRVGPKGDGRLRRVSDDLTGTYVDFGYDKDGRLVETVFSNGEINAFAWDAADRLIRIRSGAHTDLQYSYDRSGRVTNLLYNAPLNSGSYITAATNTLTFDAASQISSPGYNYDMRSRMIAAPGRKYQWDAASRLAAAGNVAIEYNALDGLRKRTKDGVSVHYYHNYALGGASPIVAEQDVTSSKFLRFYVRAPDGRFLYLIDTANGNKVHFYHFDRNGSTIALTDNSRVVTDAYAYDPYGRLIGRTGSNPQPYTYVGAWGVRQEGGDGTLYQMGARYYDAQVGQFISPEPVWPQLENPERLNPYQYAAQDPIRFIDPTGMDPEDPLKGSQWQPIFSESTSLNMRKFKGFTDRIRAYKEMRESLLSALYSPWIKQQNPLPNLYPQLNKDSQLSCRQQPKNKAPVGVHKGLPIKSLDAFLEPYLSAHSESLEDFLNIWPQVVPSPPPSPIFIETPSIQRHLGWIREQGKTAGANISVVRISSAVMLAHVNQPIPNQMPAAQKSYPRVVNFLRENASIYNTTAKVANSIITGKVMGLSVPYIGQFALIPVTYSKVANAVRPLTALSPGASSVQLCNTRCAISASAGLQSKALSVLKVASKAAVLAAGALSAYQMLDWFVLSTEKERGEKFSAELSYKAVELVENVPLVNSMLVRPTGRVVEGMVSNPKDFIVSPQYTVVRWMLGF